MNFRPLTENYVASVTIPANIAPISSSSPAIQRLLTKRKNDHNTVTNFIKQQFHKHNLEIDEEIRQESEQLLENLENMKNEFANATIVLKSEGEELVKLDTTIFQTLPVNVQDMEKKKLEIVDEHYESLKRLEKERSKRFKGVLNKAYRKMGKIYYLLPYNLSQYFEDEILKLNEITLNNFRHYSKIHSDLKQQILEEFRIFQLELMETKDRHRRVLKWAKVKGVVHLYKSDILGDSHKLDALAQLEPPSFTAHLPHSADDVEIWSKHVQRTLDELDANARKLINSFKTVVIHVFNRFFEELKNVTSTLLEDGPVDSLLDANDINNEVYMDVVDDITETYTCDIAELQELWDSITAYMESNIQNTYTFLNGTAHLWDGHFIRVQDIGHIIIQDLKLVIDKHDKAANNFDIKINTTLDKLREDSTLPKLNEHLRDANKFLDSIGKLYSSQCDAEIKVLQKYRKLMDQAIDVLISEVDRFLSENEKNENIQERRSGWADVKGEFQEEMPENPKDNLIPHQMKACQFQVDAVNNWMFGLWEAIRHYMQTCHSELTAQAEFWVDNITEKLKKRLEVRLATHKPRYPRIKTIIYDVRLKELEEHLDDFNRVEERVKQYMVDSSSFTYLCEDHRVKIIENYEKFLKGIEKKLQRSTKSQQVAACLEQTKHVADDIVKQMEETFEENLRVIEENRSKIDKIICHFSNSIKLFAEGGNHSRDETKSFKKKIQKIKKELPKKYKKILWEYNTMKKETTENFTRSQKAILARLEHSKAEFEHNETTCQKIKDLQDKIRRFAYDIKFKLHRIDACIDYYSEISKNNIWKRKHFELIKDAIQEGLDKMKELTDVLIEDEKSDSGYYLSQLNGLIDISFKEIKETSEGFYTSHGAVINKGKIHGTVDTFLDEVKKNYDGFSVQVEIHYLECVQELIQYIIKLLNVNDEVYDCWMREMESSIGHTKSEESSALSTKLSEESLVCENRKKFLQGEVVDPAAKEVILKNKERVEIIHNAIRKLWNVIENKLSLIEEVVIEEKESEE